MVGINILTSIRQFLKHHFGAFFDNIEEFYLEDTLSLIQGILSAHSSISSIAKDGLTGLSHSTLTRFVNGHDEFWKSLKNKISAEIFKSTQNKSFLLVVDDTQIPRRGKHIPFAVKSYDHCSRRFQNSQVLLTVGVVYKGSFFPIDMLFSNVKGSVGIQQMTKNDQLIRWLKENSKEVENATLIGDSWFTHSYVVESAVMRFGMNFIGRIRSNFKFRMDSSMLSVGEYQRNVDMDEAQEVEIDGRKIRVHERISFFQSFRIPLKHVVCENESANRMTLIATNTNLSGVEVVMSYLERWKIETFFKMAKQELALKDCKLLLDKGQEHWKILVMLAYMIFKDHEMMLSKQNEGATKKDIFKVIHDALSGLRARISQVKKNFRMLHSQFTMPEIALNSGP